MNILVINAGSSSLKYQLFDMTTQEVRAKGLCERIGIDGKFKHEANGKKVTGDTPMATHADAIRHLTKICLLYTSSAVLCYFAALPMAGTAACLSVYTDGTYIASPAYFMALMSLYLLAAFLLTVLLSMPDRKKK